MLTRSCGVLWGAATNPNTDSMLDAVEQQVGQHFDLTYRFHDLDDRFPTAEERAAVEAGRALHVDIDSRIYGSPNRPITWRTVTSGKFDTNLVRQARGIAALGRPVFVTFDHEPDQSRRAALGTPADYVAAWRHVHQLYAAAGVTNVVWVWVVTGYPPLIPVAARMWPGNAYVDWISWEGYNPSGCQTGTVDPGQFISFGQAVLPFYDWLRRDGQRDGIDTGKPIMISEAASTVYPSAALTALWYSTIPPVLAAHRAIRAITLWDRPGATTCRYRFDRLPLVSRAVGTAMAATRRTTVPTSG